MKLWQKNFEVKDEIEKFTVGRDKEFDLLLAPFDVLGSMAHAIMLENIGLITTEEAAQLLNELKNIYNEIEEGKFTIGEDVEDVHSQIEFLLTERIGDTGKKIHSGRSRNDQVLLDLKLFIRHEIKSTVGNIQLLFEKLVKLSEKHKHKLLPGYTHFQLAMPSSFGLWFGAYAESLVDDMHLLKAAYKVANKNPLGSAAGYGSSFPLNRQMTTQLLGFDCLNYNVVYAQMGRGKTEKFTANALAAVASTLGRMAMDICLFMNQNFGFVSFPDEYTTGSSIMPHKKNPDVFEIIRGKCNKLQALPNELALITANLPSGYHRDLQLIKESFLPAFAELNSCLEMAGLMLDNIIIKDNILEEEKYKYLFSVESVNDLVLEGLPFREAYHEVSKSIADDSYNPSRKINHTHEGSIGNLCNEEIVWLMNEVVSRFDFNNVDKALENLLEYNFYTLSENLAKL